MTPGTARVTEHSYRIADEEGAIENAQRFAEIALSHCDKKSREAAAIAVLELVNNLIKYADGTGRESRTLRIQLDGEWLRIQSHNTVLSHEDGLAVVELVDKINSTPSICALYRDRLRTLLTNPAVPRAQLGLLRIAYEGGFRLSCTYTAGSLEIEAERHLEAAR